MTENRKFLCEVVFSDHNLGLLTSLIGHIDENQLNQFSNGLMTSYNGLEKYPLQSLEIKLI